MPNKSPLVIVGGNSMVAGYLIERLDAAKLTAEIISRSPLAVPEGFSVTHMDLTSARNWIAPERATVISLLPLWVLTRFLPRFMGVETIIAVGSTSRFTKADSSDRIEQATAAKLAQAEAELQQWAQRTNTHFTMLRPTLVYDGIRDKNIARMKDFIRRYRGLPLAAPAKGLRQPIHADDVAKAIMGTIGNPQAVNRSFNIAGGEVLTYRSMAERVFASVSMKSRFLMLPTGWLQKLFRAGSRIGLLSETAFGSSLFQRMNEDLIFDVDEGLQVLNYQPRGFEP